MHLAIPTAKTFGLVFSSVCLSNKHAPMMDDSCLLLYDSGLALLHALGTANYRINNPDAAALYYEEVNLSGRPAH